MAAEELTTSPADRENGMANYTGLSVLLAIGEPFYEDQKDLILDRIRKSLLSYTNKDGFDLSQELENLAAQAPSSEEGPGGEQLIQYNTDAVRVTILANPQCQTFYAQLREFLTMPAQQRLLVFSGPILQGCGSWIFQDDLVSFSAFAAVFKETDIQNALRQQEGTTLDLHIIEQGDWSVPHVNKQSFSSIINVRVNPAEVIQNEGGVLSFIEYLSLYVKLRSCKDLLQSSDVVGNIRFTRPTLYVFPGAQGDSALFGISGFNLLINAGYSRKACFWGFTRHLDRIDAMLLTHLGADNLFGVGSVFERKAFENVHPEIGYVYFNAIDKTKHSPNGDIHPENGGVHKPASLVVSLVEQGKRLVDNIKMTGQSPQTCVGQVQNGVLQPMNLYHKVGHGTLDMYVLNPSQDSKELKDFLAQWNKNVNNFTANKNGIPLPSQASICALLVWKPSSPNEQITRILFPGNAPQERVFDGLDKLKTLDIFKHATCSETSLHAPKKKPAAGGLKAAKGPSNARASPILRGSPVPVATKPEPKKTAPAPEKKTMSKAGPASKPAKDAKNKKATGASQKEGKTPPSSSSASKVTTPTESPVSTATPSNTPIETVDMPPEKPTEVAAEIAASLESQKSPEPLSPVEVQKSPSEEETASLVSEKSPEEEVKVVDPEPVVTPDDVKAVVDLGTESPPEPPTDDLLGDFSAAQKDDGSEPEPFHQEPQAEPLYRDVEPPYDEPIPQEPVAPINDAQGSFSPPEDLTPVEPEADLALADFSEQPQAVPDPVQSESLQQQEQLPAEDFTAFQQKEVVPESEKDEDTSECNQVSAPAAEAMYVSEQLETAPAANGFNEVQAQEAAGHSGQDLMESPEALPDPQELAPAPCLEAMQTSFSEDRGENLFAAPAEKVLEVEELPEAEQPQSDKEVSAVDKAFDDILDDQDSQKAEDERQRYSISSEDDQALPTPEETMAEGQFDQEYTRQITRELQRPQVEAPQNDDPFTQAEPVEAPLLEQIPAETKEERKRSLAEFGIMEDDAALVEGLSTADTATLQELGLYEEPEADQQQQDLFQPELTTGSATETQPELATGSPTEAVSEPEAFLGSPTEARSEPEAFLGSPTEARSEPDDAEADQQDLQPEPVTGSLTKVQPEALTGSPTEAWPQPEDTEADQGYPYQDDILAVDLQCPVMPQEEQDDLDNDSLADNGVTEPGAQDSLECLSGVAQQEVPADPTVEERAIDQPSNPFDIVDASRGEAAEPFNNPFVGVNLNASAQPNDFNIPDVCADDVPPQCFPDPYGQQSVQSPQGDTQCFPDPYGQQSVQSQGGDAERDSLERDEAKSFDPLNDWGQPMGLPAPDGPAPKRDPKKTEAKKPTSAGASKTTAKAGATAAKKPAATKTQKPATEAKKAPERSTSPRKPAVPPAPAATRKSTKPESATRKAIPKDDKKAPTAAAKAAPAKSAPSKVSTPTKASAATKRTATSGTAKAPAPVKLAPVTPFYVDLTYIPGHGDNHYSDFDFFRKVRARYYVLSSLNPSASLLTSLVDAKQTWDDPSLEVTVIPTYDTDTLRHWMALNRDQISQNKIDFAPSASRCTIQLQDHEASCAAYRLEF